MCIVLLTTAHPDYALIVIDNRDEFVTRPTSRPHWWQANGQEILSSRDLQRAEQGTWLGVTRSGKLAVLTNYRESDTDLDRPVQGQKSRGAMVTAWLASPHDETTGDFVARMLNGDGVKGVGGFSLVCGSMRMDQTNGARALEPLTIISNRAGNANDVPWIAAHRKEVHGLSNTAHNDPITWPKVELGKSKLTTAVEEVIAAQSGEEVLVEKLWDVLDTNTLPPQGEESFEQYIFQLRKSIFIPPIGGSSPEPPAEDVAAARPMSKTALQEKARPSPAPAEPASGIYGTQRQTIILVDWKGTVSYRERALWDEKGRPLPRGEGDVKFEYKIEGWNSVSTDTMNGLDGVH